MMNKLFIITGPAGNEFKMMNYSENYYLDNTCLNIEETAKEILDNTKYLL